MKSVSSSAGAIAKVISLGRKDILPPPPINLKFLGVKQAIR